MSSILHRAYAANPVREGGEPTALLDTDMRHVADAMLDLAEGRLEYLTPAEARRQPTLQGAMRALLARSDRTRDDGVTAEDISCSGAEGALPARLYRPTVAGEAEAPPVILYFHGGLFVTGDLDGYDETPRRLAQRTGAVVVSAHYRLAPEHRFPAAHDDAAAIWAWLPALAAAIAADPGRLAIAGEGAGATLALHAVSAGRTAGLAPPRHQVLICPQVGADLASDSMFANLSTRPFGAAALNWSIRHVLETREGLGDPRLDPASRPDLSGLPPTTLILAGADPLHDAGEALAQALARAGVWVEATTYDGVTHDFFGLGRMVNKALFAESQVASNLHAALAWSGRAA